MHPVEQHYLDLTRRRFFGRCADTLGAGLGSLALTSLLASSVRAEGTAGSASPAAPSRPWMRPAKAKRVIYLHMEGAPSQIDLFDYKPGLGERFNEELPDSIRQGQRLTGMTSGQTRFRSLHRSSSSRSTRTSRMGSISAS